jgi:hypothetical protein
MDFFEVNRSGRLDPSNFGLWLNLDYAIKNLTDTKLLSLMMTTFHFPLTDEHRNFVNSRKSEEEAALAINCFTMFSHEMRHFHDLLVCPYGSMLMRQYARAAFLCTLCKHDLYLRSSAIVVPLSDWIASQELFERAHSVPPPSSNLRDLNETLETMKVKLDVFNRGSIPLPSPFESLDATSILEALAILNQENLISKEFGDEKVSLFRRSFKSPASISRYYGPLYLISAILVSLCGNFQDPDFNRVRYPKDILVQLLIWLREHKFDASRVQHFEEIVDIVDQYFEERHGGDVQSMITQAARTNEEVEKALYADLSRFEEQLGNEDERARSVLKGFNNFRLAQGDSQVML